MAFENATSLSSSEVFLSLAGWLLIAKNSSPQVMIFIGGVFASMGSALGASLLYWGVRLGGRPLVDWAVRLLRVDPRYILWIEHQFRRRGPGLVFFGRVVPVMRILVTVPAALVGMSYPKFLLYSFSGAYIWNTLFLAFGYGFGKEWPLIVEIMQQFTPWFLAGAAGLIGFILLGRRMIQQRLHDQLVMVETDQDNQ